MESPRPPPSPDERPSPPEHIPATQDDSPLSDNEQRDRTAYIERNLWLALAGLLLFFLAL